MSNAKIAFLALILCIILVSVLFFCFKYRANSRMNNIYLEPPSPNTTDKNKPKIKYKLKIRFIDSYKIETTVDSVCSSGELLYIKKDNTTTAFNISTMKYFSYSEIEDGDDL